MQKNIILCFDGTGNKYGENNTNVVKIFENIIRNEKQVGLYDPGVGISSLLGKAFGAGLQKNIEDGYMYLLDRFEHGDKIFIFGFSRGAFTARSLAGMLYHFGLLEKGSNNLLSQVSNLYNKKKLDMAKGFKSTFSRECKPHFIGVWDTVASLGYFHGKTFYDPTLNPDIKYAYQAAAIDEKRKKFPISLWDENKKKPYQKIEQVWFAGVHSDVGGYYKELGLSDIALGWMMDMAIAHGMIAKPNWQKNLKQDCTDKLHNSRNGFWRLWRKRHRSISKGALFHQSVLDRIKKDEKYRPKNVKKELIKNVITNHSYKT